MKKAEHPSQEEIQRADSMAELPSIELLNEGRQYLNRLLQYYEVISAYDREVIVKAYCDGHAAASKIANQGEEEKPEVKQEPVGYLAEVNNGPFDTWLKIIPKKEWDVFYTMEEAVRRGATVRPVYYHPAAPVKGEEEKLRAEVERLRMGLDNIHNQIYCGMPAGCVPAWQLIELITTLNKICLSALNPTPTEDETGK